MLGIALLWWLVVSLGRTEIGNVPFNNQRVELIQKRLESSVSFSKEVDKIKRDHSVYNKQELEEAKLVLHSYFTYYEQMVLGLEKVKKDLSEADYRWVSMALIIALLSHYFRALRWNMLINAMGYRPRSFITFLAVMIGYLANVAVPRAGEVSRCIALSKSEKIPVDKLLGTVILERGIDLLCLLFLVVLTFLLQIDIIYGFFSEVIFKDGEGMSFIKGLKIISTFLVILIIAWLSFKLTIKIIKRTKWFYRFKRLYVGFLSGLKTIKKLDNIKGFIFHTFMIWFGYFLMVHLCFPAYSPFAELFYKPIVGLGVLVIGSLGMVAPVQGGIGAYHFCVQVCMELYGYSKDLGLSFAFIVHTSQTLIIIVGGVIAVILLPLASKWNRDE